MSTVWPLIVIAMSLLWVLDHYFLKAQFSRSQINREEIEKMEKELQKERRDAVSELNMIQSRLILFMKLENEIIQKERDSTLEMKQKSDEMKKLLEKMEKEKAFWKVNISDQVSQIQTIASEKAIGFPWLAKAYAEFFYLQDMKLAEQLEKKQGLPKETVNKIQEIALQRRIAEEKLRLYQYLLEFYECLFPWLSEFRDSGIDEIIADREKDLMEQMHLDPICNWLSDKENRDLSPALKNQLALERFLDARKSKWQLDQDYERYLAYEYEKNGWSVQFISLQEEFPDFLRVILARKEEKTFLVQARQTPFQNPFLEKLLLNFFFLGVETYRDQNPGEVPGQGFEGFLKAIRDGAFKMVFVTAQEVPEVSQGLAGVLNIKVEQNRVAQKFPVVKGRLLNASGEKRYYLPLDREYDNAVPGETTLGYFERVVEAEEAGCRREIKIPEAVVDLPSLS